MRTIKNKFVKWDRVVDQETQEWNNITDLVSYCDKRIIWLLSTQTMVTGYFYLCSPVLRLTGVMAIGYDVMTHVRTKKEVQDFKWPLANLKYA